MVCGDAGNRMRQVSPYYYNIIEKASASSSKLWYTAYTKPKCFKGNQNTEFQVCYHSSSPNATLTFKTQFACCWDVTHGYCFFLIFLNSSKRKASAEQAAPHCSSTHSLGLLSHLIGFHWLLSRAPWSPVEAWKCDHMPQLCPGSGAANTSLSSLQDSLGHFLS